MEPVAIQAPSAAWLTPAKLKMIASNIEAGVMQNFFLIDDITLLMEIEQVRTSSSSPRQIVGSDSNRCWREVNVIRFMKRLLILITGKWAWKLSSRGEKLFAAIIQPVMSAHKAALSVELWLVIK